MDLYPFQVDGVNRLVRSTSLLLADDMGLGKTVQVAVAMRRLFGSGAIRRALIVCPASLCYNWRRELGTWARGIPAVLYEGGDRHGMLAGSAPVLIGSLQTIVSDLRHSTRDGDRFHDIGVDLIVLDEAQRIKDPDSLRSKVLSRILAPRRWALTGTPLENHPRELTSILRFLFPNELRYVANSDEVLLTLELRDRSMIRRTKAEVGLQLPERQTAYVLTALTPDQAAEYQFVCDEVRRSVLAAGSVGAATVNLLGGLQRLRRIATISTNGESGKIDLIEEEIQEITERGGKAVLFSSFPNLALRRAAERLVMYEPVLFTGEMTLQQREAAHRRFVEDHGCRVMCASLTAGGVGISWTVACYVYQLDIWWNPQVLRQAEDRVHRIGQREPVLIKRLLAEGTIEEGIRELHTAKEEIFDFVIDQAPDAVPSPLPLEHLLGFLGLRPEHLTGVSRRN